MYYFSKESFLFEENLSLHIFWLLFSVMDASSRPLLILLC